MEQLLGISNYLFSVDLSLKDKILLDLFESAIMAPTEKLRPSQKETKKVNLRGNQFSHEIFQKILLIFVKKPTANVP